jgi:hypothetical protein
VQVAYAIFRCDFKFIPTIVTSWILFGEPGNSVEWLVDVANIVYEESEIKTIAEIEGNSSTRGSR